MFDDLITDSKIPIKAPRSTKIEGFELIIFDISIIPIEKQLLALQMISHTAKNNKLNFWQLKDSHNFVKIH